MQTIGYYTVEDRNNPKEILEAGPFFCGRGDAWLSPGYYFWDNDIRRAHDWGKGYRKSYVICKADLQLKSLLDLCSIAGKRHFNSLLETILTEFEEYQLREIPIGLAIAHLKKISQNAGFKEIFPFDSVRADDCPKDSMQPFTSGRKESICLDPRVQICLFEKNSENLRSFEIVYPENYV